ncbi:MAG TPA: hemolysin III family protein [Candidatus Hydrogenedentes bacterium]|nr:hemolysin III family protein [Candidatus Hydrogenedentota bacterium]
MTHRTKHYSLPEEIANSLTHGVGAVLSAGFMAVLVYTAWRTGDPWRVAAALIFGLSLLFMYLASTLYHAVPSLSLKHLFRTLDHCAIYVLIAGTYTPFLLVSMRGTLGWTLFCLVWGLAVLGCAWKAFFVGRWDRLSTLLYVGMGWIVLVALKPAVMAIPPGAILLMLFGGLAYTGGVVFYVWDRLPFNHAVWHGFVLTGSALHAASVFAYVIR